MQVDIWFVQVFQNSFIKKHQADLYSDLGCTRIRISNSQQKKEFEEKEKVYTKANKKLQVDITELESKDVYLIAENAYSVTIMAKLKSLYYLNKSK